MKFEKLYMGSEGRRTVSLPYEPWDGLSSAACAHRCIYISGTHTWRSLYLCPGWCEGWSTAPIPESDHRAGRVPKQSSRLSWQQPSVSGQQEQRKRDETWLQNETTIESTCTCSTSVINCDSRIGELFIYLWYLMLSRFDNENISFTRI